MINPEESDQFTLLKLLSEKQSKPYCIHSPTVVDSWYISDCRKIGNRFQVEEKDTSAKLCTQYTWEGSRKEIPFLLFSTWSSCRYNSLHYHFPCPRFHHVQRKQREHRNLRGWGKARNTKSESILLEMYDYSDPVFRKQSLCLCHTSPGTKKF